MLLLQTVLSDPRHYVLATLALITIVLIVWVTRLEFRLKRFTRGKNGCDLEESIVALEHHQQTFETSQKEIERYLTQVEQRLTRGVRDIKTVRFNPFKGSDVGGNQSFATALLNEEGDGVILSSLYTRERVSVFAKPIQKYESEHELTEEERSVLDEVKRTSPRK